MEDVIDLECVGLTLRWVLEADPKNVLGYRGGKKDSNEQKETKKRPKEVV